MILGISVSVAVGTTGVAQEFDLTWHTVDGGGVMQSAGADFELSGTIGQADAGTMTGGGFDLTGGFWAVALEGECHFDGTTRLGELPSFVDCLAGPGASFSECQCSDIDYDGDVDLSDFAAFQEAFHDVD